MSLIEEGQEIARKLGGEVIYERPWLPYGPEGEFLGHFFTDVLTGSSFSAKTLEEAKATLIQSRKDWKERPPVFANNPGVKGGKMPERAISPAVILIPVGLGLGLLGVLAAVAWAARAAPTPPPGLANLYGKVTDAITGSPISGVLVSLNGMETLTDGAGDYILEDLDPRGYVLQFSKGGYDTATY